MVRKMFRCLVRIGLAGAIGLASMTAPALSFGFFKPDGEPLACGHEKIVRLIVSKFDRLAKHARNQPDLGIHDMTNIHQHRYVPDTGKGGISRRYCHANVHLTNGSQRKVWYLIEDGMGFASIGDNVEFCVSGYEVWFEYNNACRLLR